MPDLVVESLTHSPTNPTTADTITFTAVVKNVGTASAPASVMALRVGENQWTTHDIPALAANASYTVTRTATMALGNYTNLAWADYTETVSESNEGNNQRMDTVTVTGMPDLIVVDIYCEPYSAPGGTPMDIFVSVQNVGTARAGASVLRVQWPGGQLLTNFDVGELEPGAWSDEYSYYIYYPVGAWDCMLGTADAEGSVTESNEGNNQKLGCYERPMY
jgi:subtilase family serine protease